MLIYEKNNKLNINFDPSKSIEGTPDIQIGENEIKLGDAEITSENVLPTPTNEDAGKIVSVGEDGAYELVPFQEPTGTIEITENGVVDVADYASANVQVPNPSSGSISITQNGTYDVKNYASADVNIAGVQLSSIPVVNNTAASITVLNSFINNNGYLETEEKTIKSGETVTVNSYYKTISGEHRIMGNLHIQASTEITATSSISTYGNVNIIFSNTANNLFYCVVEVRGKKASKFKFNVVISNS